MQEALSDHELYDHLVEHRERYNKISGIDYSLHHHATINFLPPVELYPALEKDFTDMRENMIYADTPPLVQMIQELKTLQARFRLKHESRPFEQIMEAARGLAKDLKGEKVEVDVVFPPEKTGAVEAKYQVNFVRIGGELVLETVVVISA